VVSPFFLFLYPSLSSHLSPAPRLLLAPTFL
jgi:hypothetical protein